jgi:hypothetical protein
VYQLVGGYEDANDSNQLRHDFSLGWAGCFHPTSPQGDGNGVAAQFVGISPERILSSHFPARGRKLADQQGLGGVWRAFIPLPRKGTETSPISVLPATRRTFIPLPRKGTETPQ